MFSVLLGKFQTRISYGRTINFKSRRSGCVQDIARGIQKMSKVRGTELREIEICIYRVSIWLAFRQGGNPQFLLLQASNLKVRKSKYCPLVAQATCLCCLYFFWFFSTTGLPPRAIWTSWAAESGKKSWWQHSGRLKKRLALARTTFRCERGTELNFSFMNVSWTSQIHEHIKGELRYEAWQKQKVFVYFS